MQNRLVLGSGEKYHEKDSFVKQSKHMMSYYIMLNNYLSALNIIIFFSQLMRVISILILYLSLNIKY